MIKHQDNFMDIINIETIHTERQTPYIKWISGLEITFRNNKNVNTVITIDKETLKEVLSIIELKALAYLPEEKKPEFNGKICPSCNLGDLICSTVITTNPPQYEYKCNKCGETVILKS